MDPKCLSMREQNYERLNNKHLLEAFKDADIIIVAWIRDTSKYVTRKREVEQLLLKYSDKVKCFQDSKGKKLRHPRDLGNGWILSEYDVTSR